MITVKDLMDLVEQERYEYFYKEHRKCGIHSTIGGGVSVIVTVTGLGYIFECKCNRCGKTEDITNTDNW